MLYPIICLFLYLFVYLFPEIIDYLFQIFFLSLSMWLLIATLWRYLLAQLLRLCTCVREREEGRVCVCVRVRVYEHTLNIINILGSGITTRTHAHFLKYVDPSHAIMRREIGCLNYTQGSFIVVLMIGKTTHIQFSFKVFFGNIFK